MIYFHHQLLELIRKRKRIVWATVIRSSGSTPQKPGSSAIFGEEGLLTGTVGGGIMEAETGTLAGELLDKRTSNLYHFDLDSKAGSEGAICGGKADLLLDANTAMHQQALDALEASLRQRNGGSLVTLVGKEKGNTRKVERYWMEGGNSSLLPEQIKELTGELFQYHSPPDLRTGLWLVKLPDEVTSPFELVFMEYVYPLPRLIIAGAGHLGKALSHLGNLLDFEVSVVDDRPEYSHPSNLPDADHVVVKDIGNFMEDLKPDSDTYCVIVTRGHVQDGEALKPLIGSEAAYVGMIGSRHKVATMKKQFLNEGWATLEQWEKIYTPVGLPIGSKTVQEIAISIAAELISVRNNNSENNGK